MFTVRAFGLYTTAVTTLASRRQNLFLKRLRSTAAGDAGILAGLLLPATVLALVQVAAILAVLAAVTGRPAQVPLLAVAVLATTAMMLGLALATAGLTNSPEHAQVTTLPVSLVGHRRGQLGGHHRHRGPHPAQAAAARRLGHRDGRQRLERRRSPARLAAPAGAHAGLGRRRRRAGLPPLPLGTTPMSPGRVLWPLGCDPATTRAATIDSPRPLTTPHDNERKHIMGFITVGDENSTPIELYYEDQGAGQPSS